MSEKSGKYCWNCFYPLVNLSHNQCPECGKAFDPDKPKTYSRYEYVPLMPRWETCVASLLLVVLIYSTWDWREVQNQLGNRTTARISFLMGQHYVDFIQLMWVSPAVLLIPVFLLSGVRVRPRCTSTIILTALVSILYGVWPATFIWYRDALGVYQAAFSTESYWEAVQALFDTE